MAIVEQLQLDFIANNEASPELKKLKTDVDNLAKATRPLKTAVQGAENSFRGMGRNAGMAGIQVQQFVGQVHAGTSPMIAFSQQASDLGFVLGFPLAGAVAGIATSLVGALIPAIMGSEESTKALREEIEGLEKAFKDLTAEQQRALMIDYQQSIVDLEHASFELRQEIYDTKNGWSALFTSQESIDKQVTLLTAKLQLNEEQIAATKKTLQDYVAGVDDSTDANSRFTSSFETLENQLKTLDALYVKFETPQEKLVRKYKEADDVLAKFAGTEDLHARMINAALEEYKKTLPVKEQVIQKTKELAGETENLNWEYQSVADNGVKAMEDGLVGLINGTKSAKEAFSDMALSIVNDLIRMQIQQSITSQMGGFLSGIFGGGVSSPASSGLGVGTAASPLSGINIGAPVAQALGGAVTAGQAYTVGEHGRETFIPNTNGAIVPNDQMGSGVTINQTIQISTGVSQTVRAEIANLMPQITNATKAAVADARQRGGGFSKALVGA